jgi:phosphatidylinositol alpha 1,6-mannosyltransferase
VSVPRVALFTDSFHEVNGVAHTSRHFFAFARQRSLPFLAVVAGNGRDEAVDGPVRVLELETATPSITLDESLRFDLMFWRHRARVRAALDRFRPDLVHVTGPGHLGILGALMAHERRVPLVASWHTNVHEYAGRRLEKLLRALPAGIRNRAAAAAEAKSLDIAVRFYRLAKLTLAPNQELVQMLRQRTSRPCLLMERGIDTALFSPERRKRTHTDFVIGYVGRIRPEKNVRLLAEMEQQLRAAGVRDYRFLIVGTGSERDWLAANMKQADFPGVLSGVSLAEAYASMDVFAFPSETDTFGNVVVEAAASGVPAVVTDKGGPKFLVEPGVSGTVASSASEFSAALLGLYRDRALLARLRQGARESAERRSWDAVFEGVYRGYAIYLAERGISTPGPQSFLASAAVF